MEGMIAAPVLVWEGASLIPPALRDFVDDGTTLRPVLVGERPSLVPLESRDVAKCLEIFGLVVVEFSEPELCEPEVTETIEAVVEDSMSLDVPVLVRLNVSVVVRSGVVEFDVPLEIGLDSIVLVKNTECEEETAVPMTVEAPVLLIAMGEVNAEPVAVVSSVMLLSPRAWRPNAWAMGQTKIKDKMTDDRIKDSILRTKGAEMCLTEKHTVKKDQNNT